MSTYLISLSLSLLFAYPFPLGESVVRRGERDTGTGFVVARLRPSKTEHTHTQTHFDVCLTVCRVCWRFPSCLVGQKRREKRPRQDSILNGAIKSVKKSSAGDSPFKYNKKQEEETRKVKMASSWFRLRGICWGHYNFSYGYVRCRGKKLRSCRHGLCL
jgi:hypothetical protein